MKHECKITKAEAGRRGGTATKNKHGHEYFAEIGRKGNEKLRRIIELGKKQEEAAQV